MVDKILSTSSFKSSLLKSRDYHKRSERMIPILSVCILLFNLQCAPKMEWIRSLPSEYPRDNKITLGFYSRPAEKKSAFGSRQFLLYWKEEIHLLPNSQFTKVWSEWKVYKDHSEFRHKVGLGNFEKSGDWVLLQTNKLTESDCVSSEKTKTIPDGGDWSKLFPCSSSISPNNRSINHRLLYYYDGKSLYPLQYESGYTEANFGIAWESDLPYTKSNLFEKAKLKYGKKEFQPHVYNHVKLD
ncbi:hypothetical protein LEP1GSC195_2299 [Leptospira wolbachii serovar Codice str. CDC]|uniref:Uncharacterized protein n=1 Tax=Leptospira wolbachii serovar Codice str. CDC TaxID=1218599 RepID=R9A4J4_9LEPT|nr:hypothetical protein [Leptospira wolbachii]EOQ96934.1 hypothetical protein LEP1GSC195_2299 [Leptospira wolbachii serovar Codice str. CDC]